MPRRKITLANNEYYHIYNRGVEKRPIFDNAREYRRFLDLIKFYQRRHNYKFSLIKPRNRQEIINTQQGILRVEIICYCLMPNHFHLTLKQVTDHGIREFVQIISNSYSHYYNVKNERVGPLLQGKFKSVRIEDDAQLLYLSRYIHLNPVISFIAENSKSYSWSSYQEYIGNEKGFCQKEIITNQFSSLAKYKEFVEDHTDIANKMNKIEHLIIEKNP